MIKSEIKGSYDKLKGMDGLQDHSQEVASAFHYRNGKKQYDGSMGEIKITYRELLDALACATDRM